MTPVRRNILLFYAFGFCMDFALWAGIWIKYLVDDRDLELRWILAMDLPFWLLVAALQAPTGALADHIGRKRVLAMSGVLYAITILGFGFTTTYWLLFFDYVIWAFAQSMRSGADQALLYDSLKAAGRETEFARISGRGFAIQLTAAMVALVAGALVADRVGLDVIVQVSAVAPLAAAFVTIGFHEPRLAVEGRRYWQGLKDGIAFAWGHVQVRYTLLVGSVLLTGTFGPVVLVQPFLIEHDVDTSVFGVLQAPIRLLSVLAALLAFRIARSFATGAIFVASCVLIILSYSGLALTGNDLAFALFGLPAIVSGLTNPVIGAHLNRLIPSERRATVLSGMQLFFSLQVAFFEPALGFFADGINVRAAFAFAAIYFLVVMPPLLFLWRRAHAGGLRSLEAEV